MSSTPRVVLGMPAYKRSDTMARTLESLFSQTFQDFALVIVDDSASPQTAAIVEAYARRFPRLYYETNGVRLGMVGNWRKVFERARELYPRSEYFAWVSDHDLWHARWLHELVAVLDTHPDVVLAYPYHLRMLPERSEVERKEFETTGMTSRAARMRKSARYMLAGNMIYGLMRADAVDRAGVFRPVLTPDRQVLLALSLFGQVAQVPEVLWYREILRVFDVGRQREVFFPNGAPLYIYLPSHVQHCATLLWDFGILGRGRPLFGRLPGLLYAAVQLWCSSVRQLVLPKSEWRLIAERSALGRRMLSLIPTAPARRVPATRDVSVGEP
jgi:glycosyltransferase involved in cell wall biosynthesis